MAKSSWKSDPSVVKQNQEIGKRIREFRSWRDLNLREAAGLAGMTYGHFGKIERGEVSIDNRQVLEAIATALKVSPTDLSGQPWDPIDSVSSEALASLTNFEAALELYELGHDPGLAARSWPKIATDVGRLVDFMHVKSDYAAQGALAPRLIGELHALYVREPARRPDVLLALIHCYSSAVWTTKRLGARGLPAIAAKLAQQCADELDKPQWRGYAAWLRGDATGQISREKHYERSVLAADELSSSLNDPESIQMFGMLHLSAALASAARSDRDLANTHLGEAAAVADRMDVEVGEFGHMWFGRTNVGIWKVSIAAEFRDAQKVTELARDIHPEAIPSPSRQAEYWVEVGRMALGDSRTREQGVSSLLRAEKLASQRVRNDIFVRQAVTDQLRRARRDAGGHELRGLAWRIGVAPNG